MSLSLVFSFLSFSLRFLKSIFLSFLVLFWFITLFSRDLALFFFLEFILDSLSFVILPSKISIVWILWVLSFVLWFIFISDITDWDWVLVMILSSSSGIISIFLFFLFLDFIDELSLVFSCIKYFSFNSGFISILYVSTNKNTFFLIKFFICFILCKDLLTILFHILEYLLEISVASVFCKKNNSAFFDLTFTATGDFSFSIINISPKCSFFLRSIIFISFFFS